LCPGSGAPERPWARNLCAGKVLGKCEKRRKMERIWSNNMKNCKKLGKVRKGEMKSIKILWVS
jgi:hypothetical protein